MYIWKFLNNDPYYLNPLTGLGRAGNQGKVYLKGIQRYIEIEEMMSTASAPSGRKQPCLHTENLPWCPFIANPWVPTSSIIQQFQGWLTTSEWLCTSAAVQLDITCLICIISLVPACLREAHRFRIPYWFVFEIKDWIDVSCKTTRVTHHVDCGSFPNFHPQRAHIVDKSFE